MSSSPFVLLPRPCWPTPAPRRHGSRRKGPVRSHRFADRWLDWSETWKSFRGLSRQRSLHGGERSARGRSRMRQPPRERDSATLRTPRRRRRCHPSRWAKRSPRFFFLSCESPLDTARMNLAAKVLQNDACQVRRAQREIRGPLSLQQLHHVRAQLVRPSRSWLSRYQSRQTAVVENGLRLIERGT